MSDTNEKTDWQKREVGALWKNEGRQQKYLSGYIKTPSGEDMKVVVFSNKHRSENDRAPHFRIYKSKELAQEASTTNAGSAETQSVDSGAAMEEGDLI